MAALPEKARVVIIGQGGIVGASVAHHLVQNGWGDAFGHPGVGFETAFLTRKAPNAHHKKALPRTA